MYEFDRMRLRPYFGATYAGIITVGTAIAAGCACLSAVMWFFRPFCEPILRVVMTVFVDSFAHGHFIYDPKTYWFWDRYVAFLGVFALALTAVAIIRKPAQDRRIDERLRRQTIDSSRGAPLEPK